MIHSVRIEATGDDAGDVQRQLHDAVGRLGLGIGEVSDEQYGREGLHYRGRLKVAYMTPMNARSEFLYDSETAAVLRMAGRRINREHVGTNSGSSTFFYADSDGPPPFYPPIGDEPWRVRELEDRLEVAGADSPSPE